MSKRCDCIKYDHCPMWGVCPHSYFWGDTTCALNSSQEEWERHNQWEETMGDLDVEIDLRLLAQKIERIKQTNDYLERTSYF